MQQNSNKSGRKKRGMKVKSPKQSLTSAKNLTIIQS